MGDSNPGNPPPAAPDAADQATASSPPSASRYLPTSGSILRLLTHTQNASALSFGIFMTLHLAAPLAAAVGGLNAADGVMVLGREIYLPLEPVLVYAPLFVHLVSSATRRAVITYKTGKVNLSTHAMTGYILAPLVVPHLLLHRLIPASPSPPIAGLSPSEFGFEFVGYAAASRVWMNIGYLALTGFGLYHAFVGGMKVLGWARRVLGRSKAQAPAGVKGDVSAAPRKIGKARRIGLKGIVATLVGVVGIGLLRLARDAKGMGSFTASRYEAVFAAAPWTALGLR